jgi:hypothetical protein
MTWKLFLHFLENYPTALPYYLIANNGIHALIHDHGDPSHGDSYLYRDIYNRNCSSRSYEDNYNSHSHSLHSHNRSHQPRRSPTTSDQPGAESQGKPVSYSYNHSLSFVFIYLDGFQAILFKFVKGGLGPKKEILGG